MTAVRQNMQAVPKTLLARADKILFVAHLALGDFTYMSRCFAAFREAYPHIAIHIWVDELRRTVDFRQWQGLKKYSLFDWLDSESYIDRVYRDTYSPWTFRRSLAQARAENYPIVVSFGLSRRTFYASLVRRISPEGFTAAIGKPVKRYDWFKQRTFSRVDEVFQDYPAQPMHISAIYAGWFAHLFGVDTVEAQRLPVLNIPQQWRSDAIAALGRKDIESRGMRQAPLVMINPFSKQDERSWTVERALALVREMQKLPRWRDAHYLINSVPEQLAASEQSLRKAELPRVHLFSAVDNFFQLPAMLAQCDLVVSVETALIHLAGPAGVPVIALMRQLSPEWVPLDAGNAQVIMVKERDGWVKDISLEDVIAALPVA